MSKETMKLKTAAEKVVELCGERPLSLGKWFIDMSEACESLREALAEQPEQEPVAFINVEQRKLEWAKYMSWDTPTVVNLPKIPLYTTPQPAQRKPLTINEVEQILAQHNYEIHGDRARYIVRMTEAAHNIKEKT